MCGLTLTCVWPHPDCTLGPSPRCHLILQEGHTYDPYNLILQEGYTYDPYNLMQEGYTYDPYNLILQEGYTYDPYNLMQEGYTYDPYSPTPMEGGTNLPVVGKALTLTLIGLAMPSRREGFLSL